MKIVNGKIRITIALAVLLFASILLVASPVVNSQVIDREFTLLIAVAPNTVGVGQSVQILAWANIYPNTYIPSNSSLYTGGSSAATYPRYHDFTFTITKPDGTTETKTFDETDPLGANYFNYAPSQVGTYSVKCEYPGESYENDPYFRSNTTFKAATSRTVTFEAQEEPISHWTEAPLPTEYWSRPVDASNQLWAGLMSSDLQFGMSGAMKDYWTNFYPYGTAPNTAHIMWANTFVPGGVVGGEMTVNDYYTGESYQSKFSPIAFNGRLYTSTRLGHASTQGYVCYDLRTGKELFRRSDYAPDSAFQYSFQWENAHGTIDFLIDMHGSFIDFFDPQNGERVFTIENATTSGAFIPVYTELGVTNDLTFYRLSGGRLIKWSFYECTKPLSGFSWSPNPNNNFNWPDGIVYNVSIPGPAEAGNYGFGTNGGECDGNVIIGRAVNRNTAPATVYLVGIDCSDGHIMWETNHQLLEDPTIWRGGGGTHLSSAGGVYLNFKKETGQVIAWDINTGQVKYTTEPRGTTDWSSYTSGWPIDSAYGNFYVGAYDGYIIAYDLETGVEQWRYYSGDAGFETPYGTYPFFLGIPKGMAICDGKIFAATGEHSPNDPLYRGERLHVIDAETGEGVWTIQGWMLDYAICDGQYSVFNGYDGRIYSFGKGPSVVDVSAPDAAVTMGTPVVIKGRVSDISGGTADFTLSARFPHGVPAVADEFMTEWMEYVYMQQPMPTDATGVEVLIDVLDANGNYRNIGTTTSDLSGSYSFTWEPDIPGDFTVVATFAGSESYWPSYSETAFTVVEPVVTPAPTPTPAPMTDTYVMGFGIAAVVAIIVIGLIIILMLRRR